MGNGKGGNLPLTCQTYLKEWYANDREEIRSKYFDKGNMVENELIEMAADKLGFGMAEKNIVSMHDEYFQGTCDIDLHDTIIDVKAPWDMKSLHDSITSPISKDYELQGRGYMRLYNKPNFILFYGLVTTPEEANYGNEISYDDIPDDLRWGAFHIKRDVAIEEEIIARVIECRKWLDEYHELVQSKLGKLISV
jgi:hypothetical protein